MDFTNAPQIRDIKPIAAGSKPPPQPTPPKPAAVDPYVKTEIVSDIPVKAQSAPPPNNPISRAPLPSSQEQPETDRAFDKILTDVNLEVKKQSPETDDKKSRLGFKKTDKKSAPQAAKGQPRQTVPIVLAVVVALALAFVAFSAFKKSGGA